MSKAEAAMARQRAKAAETKARMDAKSAATKARMDAKSAEQKARMDAKSAEQKARLATTRSFQPSTAPTPAQRTAQLNAERAATFAAQQAERDARTASSRARSTPVRQPAVSQPVVRQPTVRANTPSSGPMNIGFGMTPPSAPAMRGVTSAASPFSAPKAAAPARVTTSSFRPSPNRPAAAPTTSSFRPSPNQPSAPTPARVTTSSFRPSPNVPSRPVSSGVTFRPAPNVPSRPASSGVTFRPASNQPAPMSRFDQMMASQPTPAQPTFDAAALNNLNLNDYIQNTMADAGVGTPAAAAAASPVDVGLGSTGVGNVAAAGDIVGAGDAGLGGASAQADLAAFDNAQADAIANADNARADAITNAEIGADTGGGTSAQADLAGFDQIGASLPGQVNGPAIATLPGQVNGPAIATLPGQVNAAPPVISPPVAPPPVIAAPPVIVAPPVTAPPVTPTPVVATPAAVTPPAPVTPPAAAAPVTTGQGISDDEMRRHLAANPGRTENEIRAALGLPVTPTAPTVPEPVAPTPVAPTPVAPAPTAPTPPSMVAPVVAPTPAPYAGAIPIALATGPAAFGSNVMTPKAPTTPFMPGISSGVPSATPLRSGINEFEQEVLRRTPVYGGPYVPPDILPPDRFMPTPPSALRRPGAGNLDPHTLGSYKQLSNNFGATMDRAGNLVATSAMPSADAIRQGQLTARIAGQNAQLSGTLGSAVDRFGNPIAAPQMPRFFREGGEAIGDNTSLAEYLQQQGDSSIDTDPLGTAQQYLADVNAVKPMTAPIRRSVKRVSRGAGSDASTSKEMNLKLPALTSSKQMTLNTSSTPEEDQNKPKGTAREQMEDLVRSYELKIKAAKNKARGLAADVFGAPTLEGPSLTKNTLAKKRFAKGGFVSVLEKGDMSSPAYRAQLEREQALEGSYPEMVAAPLLKSARAGLDRLLASRTPEKFTDLDNARRNAAFTTLTEKERAKYFGTGQLPDNFAERMKNASAIGADVGKVPFPTTVLSPEKKRANLKDYLGKTVRDTAARRLAVELEAQRRREETQK